MHKIEFRSVILSYLIHILNLNLENQKWLTEIIIVRKRNPGTKYISKLFCYLTNKLKEFGFIKYFPMNFISFGP